MSRGLVSLLRSDAAVETASAMSFGPETDGHGRIPPTRFSTSRA